MANVPFANATDYRTPDGSANYLDMPDFTSAAGAVGEGLSKIGEAVGQYAEQQQKQDDITAVNSAMNDFQTHVRNAQYGNPDAQAGTPEASGYFGLQSKAAVDGLGSATQSIDDYRKSLMQGMSGDQMRAFQQSSLSFQNSAFNAMYEHAGRQRQAYQDQTDQDSLANLANIGAGNLNNPGAFSHAINSGRNLLQTRMALQGIPMDSPIAQAKLQQWNDQFFTQAARASTDNNDAIRAQGILDANRGNMSATAYAQASEQNRPHLYRQQGTLGYHAVSGDPEAQPTAIPQGTDPDATFAAMIHLESGGQQTDSKGAPLTSGAGAVGRAQLMPDTARQVAQQSGIGWDENRFRTDGNYNQALGQAFFSQLCQRYGGNQTLACAAYNAGPGNVDKWIKQNGDPRTGAISDADFVAAIPFDETRNYVSRAGAAQSAPNDPPSHTAPDWNAREVAISKLPIADEAKTYAYSLLNRDKSIWEATTATQRGQLADSLKDLGAAYAHGNTTNDIPEAQIRQLQEPEQAERTIQGLQVMRQGADEANALRFAPPDQVAAAMQRDTDAMRNGEDIGSYQKRVQVANMRNAVITQRMEAMKKDPATYVASAPAMQQASQAVQTAQQSGDPSQVAQAQQAYAAQSMAMQRYLAPNQTPRILTNDQVQALSQQISSADPAKEDIGQTMDGIARQYGQQWPKAFGELVQYGKLPPDYQVLANMDTADQTMARADFQRALQAGTLPQLQEAAGQAASNILPKGGDDPVEDQLAAFRATTVNSSGGDALYRTVHDATKRLALYYIAHGQDSSTALTNAVDGVINSKYDISGSMRVPKGMLPAARTATASVLSSLRPSDLAPIPGSAPGLTDQDRKDFGISAARSGGQWVPNNDESGLVLVIPPRNGATPYVMRRKDGSPVTVTFDGMRSGQYGKGGSSAPHLGSLNTVQSGGLG
ncbi:transglycosylase SLT domain-containing protein [Komagataeibacter oboediens]|uniref:transglycosylase SLT domain-containing protein n=1 Tax=Komagataeibacter oboediens TaxID=65958 RepID=UPI0023DC6662|nr:transglycosylase SLT domain-containing protein [Komagataeibacter oboediens]WEQ51215.1 transglycosylase SLT domain-containing protein [Komagataeibacter oboediens]